MELVFWLILIVLVVMNFGRILAVLALVFVFCAGMFAIAVGTVVVAATYIVDEFKSKRR